MSEAGRRPLFQWLQWPAIQPESAQLAGWTMVGLASVSATRIAPTRILRPATAALRDALIVGQLVAAGLVVFAAAALWRRFGPKRAVFAYLTIAVVTVAIAAPALREDMSNLATQMRIPYDLARWLLIVGASLAVPIAALLGRLLGRPWLRVLGLLGGIALAVANNFVLPDDYGGMHLLAGISAATLFGAAAATPGAPARRAGRYAVRVLALLGAWAVLIRPANGVSLAVQRVPGDVVAPWLARLREGDDADVDARDLGAVLSPAEAEWWKSRLGHPPVPPSTPSLIARDAIVLLITVDCLRADVLAGSTHAATLPSLFALRDASVEFTDARATATATTQSVTAIFTGRYYSQLFWKPRPNWNAEAMYPNADPSPRFTELLTPAGIRTVTISGLPGLTKEFGIVKGFQEERQIPGSGRGFAPAGKIGPPVLKLLGEHSRGPLFLYVHFTDAHAPYDHTSTKGKPFERYLRGLGHVDEQIGALVRAIDGDPALRDRVTILLSADHGEAFGEHGSQYHATTIYEELLRVPLLARVPGVKPRKVTRPVTLLDVAPTILDLYGQPTPGEMMGQSLVPFFRGEDPELTRPIIADSSRLQRAVVFRDGFKIVHDRRRDTIELFDLGHDPKELHDLFDQSGASGAMRLHALKAFFKVHTLKKPGYKVPYGR